QGTGEFIKGIREDTHLEAGSQPIQKLCCSVEGTQSRNHLLNFFQAGSMLCENSESHGHQLVVIGDITRGGAQLRDTGFFGELYPDFRDENSFEVETCDFHRWLLSIGGLASQKPSKESAGS